MLGRRKIRKRKKQTEPERNQLQMIVQNHSSSCFASEDLEDFEVKDEFSVKAFKKGKRQDDADEKIFLKKQDLSDDDEDVKEEKSLSLFEETAKVAKRSKIDKELFDANRQRHEKKKNEKLCEEIRFQMDCDSTESDDQENVIPGTPENHLTNCDRNISTKSQADKNESSHLMKNFNAKTSKAIKRKCTFSNRLKLFASGSEDPKTYSPVIKTYFDNYFAALANCKTPQPNLICWDRPIIVGRRFPGTLDFMKPQPSDVVTSEQDDNKNNKRECEEKRLRKITGLLSETSPKTSKDSAATNVEAGLDVLYESKKKNFKNLRGKRNYKDSGVPSSMEFAETNSDSSDDEMQIISEYDFSNSSDKKNVSSKKDENGATSFTETLKKPALLGWTLPSEKITLKTRSQPRNRLSKSSEFDVKQVLCPLCNQMFKSEEIERHASRCMETTSNE